MTKLFIPVLLLLACCAMAQNTNNYARLSDATINKSQVIQDLRDLGYNYALQQILFVENNKYNLPTGLFRLLKTESVDERISGRVAYYKYTVQLSTYGDKIIRVIYTVSFDQATGATKVISYTYSLIKSEDGPMIADLPSYIDVRGISNGTDLESKLLKGVKFTVENATANGQIRRGAYSVGQIFTAFDSGYSYPYVYNFLVTLVCNKGYAYRAKISVPVTVSQSISEDGKVTSDFPVTYTIYPNK